jgi:hypothetical protein
VYVFREITTAKGSFRPREEQPSGEISLKHFCILGIFRRITEYLKGEGNEGYWCCVEVVWGET